MLKSRTELKKYWTDEQIAKSNYGVLWVKGFECNFNSYVGIKVEDNEDFEQSIAKKNIEKILMTSPLKPTKIIEHAGSVEAVWEFPTTVFISDYNAYETLCANINSLLEDLDIIWTDENRFFLIEHPESSDDDEVAHYLLRKNLGIATSISEI